MKGEAAFLDFLLLSRANYLIKNRSSLSNAEMMFNNALSGNYTYILSEDDPVYHADPTLPQPPWKVWKETF